jgi:hypothetical protein
VARLGNFSPQLTAKGWFGTTFADPLNGWFDGVAVGRRKAPPPPPPPPRPAPIPPAGGGMQEGGSWEDAYSLAVLDAQMDVANAEVASEVASLLSVVVDEFDSSALLEQSAVREIADLERISLDYDYDNGDLDALEESERRRKLDEIEDDPGIDRLLELVDTSTATPPATAPEMRCVDTSEETFCSAERTEVPSASSAADDADQSPPPPEAPPAPLAIRPNWDRAIAFVQKAKPHVVDVGVVAAAIGALVLISRAPKKQAEPRRPRPKPRS